MSQLTGKRLKDVCRATATISVNFYVDAIEQDTWLEDGIAWLFGASSKTNIGRIVHNIWVGLYKHGLVTRDDLIECLVDGWLPRFFEACVRMHSNSGYAQMLLRGDRFKEIDWDEELQKRLSGELPTYIHPDEQK